jgi:predicted ester cyclase
VREIRGAFPDIQVKVEDVFGAGDKVVLRWSAIMTHTGDALGLTASGRTVRSRGITIARIVDGKVVEGWDNWDQLGMLEQIGVYKQPLAA